MHYPEAGHFRPWLGNREDMVGSWIQTFDSIGKGVEGEWALAEGSIPLDNCRTIEGQA